MGNAKKYELRDWNCLTQNDISEFLKLFAERYPYEDMYELWIALSIFTYMCKRDGAPSVELIKSPEFVNTFKKMVMDKS